TRNDARAADRRPKGANTLVAAPGNGRVIAKIISSAAQAGVMANNRKVAARRSALSGNARKARAAASHGEARKQDKTTKRPKKLTQKDKSCPPPSARTMSATKPIATVTTAAKAMRRRPHCPMRAFQPAP